MKTIVTATVVSPPAISVCQGVRMNNQSEDKLLCTKRVQFKSQIEIVMAYI